MNKLSLATWNRSQPKHDPREGSDREDDAASQNALDSTAALAHLSTELFSVSATFTFQANESPTLTFFLSSISCFQNNDIAPSHHRKLTTRCR